MPQIRNTMMLLVTIHAVLTMEAAAKTLPCLAQNHQYYHKQHGGCLDCEPCIPGEEQMDLQKWAASKPPDIFTIHGPTQCPICVKCRMGFFNDRRAFECTRCKNCTLHNKHEVQPCTSLSDAVCDGVLSSKRSDVEAKYELSINNDSNDVHPVSVIAISFLAICVMILAVILIRRKYKQYRKKQRNAVLDAEEGSSAPLMPNVPPSKIRRKRHASEPSTSSYTSERRMKNLHRNLSDPGQGYSADIETDGTQTSVSPDKRINTDFLVSLSKLLCERSSYIPFARKLGLSDASIDAMKHDFEKDGMDEVSYRILAKLHNLNKLVYEREAIETLKSIKLPHLIVQLQ